MTAASSSTPRRPNRTGLRALAGVLAFVCLVLFLLAIEQKQAVAAWRTLRHDAVPAAGRVVRWAADGAADGLSGLRTAAGGSRAPLAAAPTDAVLAGEFAPADEATREATGAAAFTGAMIRLEKGETFRTRPLRIVAGRDRFASDQTFAARLDAPADAQVELRRVIPQDRGGAVAPSPLCGGRPPGTVALLHRQGRVDVMLFRERTIVGPDASPAALCGAWRYQAR